MDSFEETIKSINERAKRDYTKPIDVLSDQFEASTERFKAVNDETIREQNIVWGYQNAGMEAEKCGNLEDAIKYYDAAIDAAHDLPLVGLNNYAHSIERACVVCRKLKRYAEEIKYIELLKSKVLFAYTEAVRHREWLYNCEKRLNRAKELLNKYGSSSDTTNSTAKGLK